MCIVFKMENRKSVWCRRQIVDIKKKTIEIDIVVFSEEKKVLRNL